MSRTTLFAALLVCVPALASSQETGNRVDVNGMRM
jgi:hypothetical protein